MACCRQKSAVPVSLVIADNNVRLLPFHLLRQFLQDIRSRQAVIRIQKTKIFSPRHFHADIPRCPGAVFFFFINANPVIRLRITFANGQTVVLRHIVH